MKTMTNSTIRVNPFPSEFDHKGEYQTYSSSWSPTGFAQEPQYPGQMSIRFPLDATLLEIQIGGYLRDLTME